MLALGVAAPTAAIPNAGAASRPVKLGSVQRAMEALAKNDGVVGAIGEVYVDGKRVGRGSAGSRLLDGKGGGIPSNARYRIGSQTKLMTATVVLQLVEEGKLELDDKLSDVLPETARQDLVDRADEITIRQLIQHTSGIPDFIASGKFDVFDFTTKYSLTDLVKASRSVPRPVEVGQYFYSTTNYILLSMIIEKVTGHDRAAEFARRLFVPLGMDHTYLATKVGDGIKGPHGHGYIPDSEGKPRDVDRLNATSWGAEGAISTARDISAFHRAFNQGKLLPANLRNVISQRPAAASQQQQQPPALCGGKPELRPVAGSVPGAFTVTFSSPDGRLQFAVSTTLKIPNHDAMTAVSPDINKAAEAVFCPGT
ncbi:beta-lactamase family protein [Nonomuraea sp. FMUSA5-5]|uniref:Beta-lactamase family protein n=1 Tax=Nonomuraea composti TaxID=2720023 RepID=A0ABX1BN68_9ACTN|nr:beta-lactamase family protein [Nonomuraea sp. FMUSA5-5]